MILISGKPFAALLAAVAAGVTGSPVELEKRTSVSPLACVDADRVQPCKVLDVIVGKCYGLDPPYYHAVSSFDPLDNNTCTLFDDYRCQGASIIVDSRVDNLDTRDFNDIAGSVMCMPISP